MEFTTYNHDKKHRMKNVSFFGGTFRILIQVKSIHLFYEWFISVKKMVGVSYTD